MKYIITGDKGLIGNLLDEKLQGWGYKKVLGVDTRSGGDILSLQDKKLNENVDILFHLAAQCKINQAIKTPIICHKANSDGFFSVMEFCRKNDIKKVVYFSSSRVLSEERNPYTAAKLYGEELCKAYHDCYGLDYLIIRPSTVYGPFDDKTHRLVDIYLRNALAGKDLEIYGDPNTKTLDFTYVDDFVDAIKLIIDGEWNKDYNISGEEEYKVYDLAKMIIDKTGSNSKIIVKNPEIAQPQKVRCDTSAIDSLGYKPKVNLEDGISRCINFYKNYKLI